MADAPRCGGKGLAGPEGMGLSFWPVVPAAQEVEAGGSWGLGLPDHRVSSELGMVAHTGNPSTWEMEARESGVPD